MLGLVAGISTGCVERVLYGEIKEDEVGSSDGDPLCDAVVECASDEVCFEGVCVGTGSLRFSLSWDQPTDFDLHVLTPTNEHVHFALPFTDYGHLDVDDCVDSTCFDEAGVHVENAFFEEFAPRGKYVVWVENFNGAYADDYQIDVVGEVNVTLNGFVPGTEGGEGQRHEVLWN